jgi:hypothetical protein
MVGSNIMNASSATITHNAHSGDSRSSGNRSATNAIGSGVIPSGEIEQLPLRIWKPAFGGDAAQRMRQLVVVLSGLGRPTVRVSGDVLQCWRVFIRHAARFGREQLQKRKILDA